MSLSRFHVLCTFLGYTRTDKWNLCVFLYNNPSYSRILNGSCLWSIRGQMHDWRHHYKVFPSAVLKWRKVLRIKIIFCLTRQKIRYKKVLPRHWAGSRSRKKKDKAVSFIEWFRKNSRAVSVCTLARKTRAKLVLVSREPLLYLEFTNPINKMFLRLILLKNSSFPSFKITVDTLIEVRNETASKHHFLKSDKINTVFQGYFFNLWNFQGNVKAFRLTRLLRWQKLTWFFQHFLQDL